MKQPSSDTDSLSSPPPPAPLASFSLLAASGFILSLLPVLRVSTLLIPISLVGIILCLAAIIKARISRSSTSPILAWLGAAIGCGNILLFLYLLPSLQDQHDMRAFEQQAKDQFSELLQDPQGLDFIKEAGQYNTNFNLYRPQPDSADLSRFREQLGKQYLNSYPELWSDYQDMSSAWQELEQYRQAYPYIYDSSACAAEQRFTYADLAAAAAQPDQVCSISLAGAGLKLIPDAVRQFKNIRALNLSHNQLQTMAPWLVELTSLEQLDLSNNLYTNMPAEIFRLPQLKLLNVSGNPIPQSTLDDAKAKGAPIP